MNPVGAYLLNGYHITSDADIRDKKYDCTKAIICLMWCILIVCAIAYVVGLVNGDLTNQCSAVIAGFGGADLLWTIMALLWTSITFTRKATEEAIRNILIVYFIPLYAIGINITAFKCRQNMTDLLYSWSVGWHIIMTGILFIGCIITLVRCCTSMVPPERKVSFRERDSIV